MAASSMTSKKKAAWKSAGETVLELLKWAAVIWCLWPLARYTGASEQPVSVPLTRVILGILFFILFGGKILYDTIIMDFIRQRRTTLKQDLVAFAGMVLAVIVLVGMVLLLVAALIVHSAAPQGSAP